MGCMKCCFALQALTIALAWSLTTPLLAGGAPLPVGADAPRLTVTIESGETVDLGELYARGPALIYFYPRSFTGGCTAQACNIRDNFDSIRAAGITVLGVSRDTVATQARFREAESLPFSLVADEDGSLGKAFGVEQHTESAYRRQSFLVANGKVVWRDLAAQPGSQSADALTALAAQQAEN